MRDQYRICSQYGRLLVICALGWLFLALVFGGVPVGAEPEAAVAVVSVSSLEAGSLEPGSEDRLVTRDVRTGLEWLDLSLTDGYSIQRALDSDFVRQHGFRLATAKEVNGLLRSAGLEERGPTAVDAEWSLRFSTLAQAQSDPLAYEVFREFAQHLGLTHRERLPSGFPGGSAVVSGYFLNAERNQIGTCDCVSTFLKGNVSYSIRFNPAQELFTYEESDAKRAVFLVRSVEVAQQAF